MVRFARLLAPRSVSRTAVRGGSPVRRSRPLASCSVGLLDCYKLSPTTTIRLLEARIQRDLGLEKLGHRATGLGLGGELFERRPIGTGNVGLQSQMDCRDRKAPIHLFQCDLRRGVEP